MIEGTAPDGGKCCGICGSRAIGWDGDRRGGGELVGADSVPESGGAAAYGFLFRAGGGGHHCVVEDREEVKGERDKDEGDRGEFG